MKLHEGSRYRLDHWADTIYLVYATVDRPVEERTARRLTLYWSDVSQWTGATVVYGSLATGLPHIALQSTKSCL